VLGREGVYTGVYYANLSIVQFRAMMLGIHVYDTLIVLHYNLRKLEHWPKLSLCYYKSVHISQRVPRRLTFQYFIVCKVLDRRLTVHKARFYWDNVEDLHFMCDVNFPRPGLQSPPYSVV